MSRVGPPGVILSSSASYAIPSFGRRTGALMRRETFCASQGRGGTRTWASEWAGGSREALSPFPPLKPDRRAQAAFGQQRDLQAGKATGQGQQRDPSGHTKCNLEHFSLQLPNLARKGRPPPPPPPGQALPWLPLTLGSGKESARQNAPLQVRGTLSSLVCWPSKAALG